MDALNPCNTDRGISLTDPKHNFIFLPTRVKHLEVLKNFAEIESLSLNVGGGGSKELFVYLETRRRRA
ncbi:hypothetical protein E2C01_060018 [Portunus trituberculatus]|uniref:Uncharacterized protein n=1 Tax=Portunus trituberculatus TaxID=210409 RepID=A0A5B7H137_PORTR|nr:hypothetical protein [Portunus trituberculatus]